MTLDVGEPEGESQWCFWMLPPLSSPTISAFCTGSLFPLLSWLKWHVSKSLQRQELDYTGIYMCVTPVTFPSKIHPQNIIYCSLECDTLSWGPLRSPFTSQEENGHTHRTLTTQFPCIALSLRKCKLWRTQGEMAALAFPYQYQLVPKPGWGCPHDHGSTSGALSSQVLVFT